MLKRLIKFSASYTVIEGAQRGILFILLPIFTHYMTPEEYGIVSTVLILVSFLSVLFSLAIHSAISRYYHKYVKEPQVLKEFLGSNFIFITLFSLMVSLVFIVFSEAIFKIFFKEIAFNPYIIYALIIVASQVVIVTYFSLLKAMQKLKLYAIVFNSYFILQIALMMIFIINYNMKQDGYLLGILISNMLFIPLIFILLKNDIVYILKFKYIKESLTYSVPIIPVELIGTINRLVDRYYILLFIGLSGVGIYYVGVQIAGIINLIAIAINSAYTPIFFQKYEQDEVNDYEEIYRLADIIVFTMGVITSVSLILSPLLLQLFDTAYQGSVDVILYLGFTGAITSIYFINTNVLSLEPKLIRLKTIGIIFGALMNGVLGYFLTEDYGIEGAAISTLISFIITTLILIFIVKRYTSFSFNNGRYMLYLSLLFIILVSTQEYSIFFRILFLILILILTIKLQGIKNGKNIYIKQ